MEEYFCQEKLDEPEEKIKITKWLGKLKAFVQ